jgi:hypothetical protein
MKLTSQMRSAASLTPGALTGEDLADIDLLPADAKTAARGDGDGPVVKGIIEIGQATAGLPNGAQLGGGGRARFLGTCAAEATRGIYSPTLQILIGVVSFLQRANPLFPPDVFDQDSDLIIQADFLNRCGS